MNHSLFFCRIFEAWDKHKDTIKGITLASFITITLTVVGVYVIELVVEPLSPPVTDLGFLDLLLLLIFMSFFLYFVPHRDPVGGI